MWCGWCCTCRLCCCWHGHLHVAASNPHVAPPPHLTRLQPTGCTRLRCSVASHAVAAPTRCVYSHACTGCLCTTGPARRSSFLRRAILGCALADLPSPRPFDFRQVAAACLYLVCRQDSKPFLLIDFSDVLQVRRQQGSACRGSGAHSCLLWHGVCPWHLPCKSSPWHVSVPACGHAPRPLLTCSPPPILCPPPRQINVFTLGAVFLQLAKLLRVTEHPMFAK